MKFYPLVSFTNFFTFLVCLLCTLKLFKIFQRRKGEFLKYFFYGFSCLTIYFFILSTPDLIIKKVLVFSIFHINAQIFLHLVAYFFLVVALRSFEARKTEKIIGGLVIISIVFNVFFSIFFFEPSTFIIKGNFYHWAALKGLFFLRLEQGIFTGSLALLTGVLFLIKGMSSFSSFVRKRSLILSLGIFLFVGAAFVNYIGGAKVRFWTLISASIIAILASLTMYSGVVLKKKKEI